MEASNLPPACSLVSTTCTAGIISPLRQGHHVDGNAAAIVDHGDGVVDVDDDVDLFGVAGQSLVDGVVDHFVDQMVQAHLAGRADVHGGAKAHRLQAFENLDVFAGVAAVVAVPREVVSCKSRHRVPFARFSLSGPRRVRSPSAFRT